MKECIAGLKEDECQYGYVRLEFQHDDTTRVKFVFFSWAGPKASALKKGKISVHKVRGGAELCVAILFFFASVVLTACRLS